MAYCRAKAAETVSSDLIGWIRALADKYFNYRFFSHQLNSKNNGPVSLFIRLYLAIETFSCHLLHQMARVTWIESGTSWASFFKFLMLYLQESLKKT